MRNTGFMVGERERLHGIDALRGAVMVLMALDHVRDFYAGVGNPTDLSTATPSIFLTRWITHFCAPVFVFLAGTSAWLYAARGRTKRELSTFLWTRGLWLIVLELTVVWYAWMMTLDIPILFLQVIAAIGVSMIVLAGLVFLPGAAIVAVGAVLVLGHNALDPIEAQALSAPGLWRFLHEDGGFALLPGANGLPGLFVVYPVLPWIGVMALGYSFGAVTRLERARRRRLVAGLGIALTLAFVALRWANAYGNPAAWSTHETPLVTALSFLNCEKYPPSLAFLLMTLGPALVLLALLDREPGRLGRVFVTFGRVPLFFYVAHLYLAHGTAQLFHLAVNGEAFSAIQYAFQGREGPTLELWGVYVAWGLVVLALYPPCLWYAGVKARSRSVLLSYL